MRPSPQARLARRVWALANNDPYHPQLPALSLRLEALNERLRHKAAMRSINRRRAVLAGEASYEDDASEHDYDAFDDDDFDDDAFDDDDGDFDDDDDDDDPSYDTL